MIERVGLCLGDPAPAKASYGSNPPEAAAALLAALEPSAGEEALAATAVEENREFRLSDRSRCDAGGCPGVGRVGQIRRRSVYHRTFAAVHAYRRRRYATRRQRIAPQALGNLRAGTHIIDRDKLWRRRTRSVRGRGRVAGPRRTRGHRRIRIVPRTCCSAVIKVVAIVGPVFTQIAVIAVVVAVVVFVTLVVAPVGFGEAELRLEAVEHTALRLFHPGQLHIVHLLRFMSDGRAVAASASPSAASIRMRAVLESIVEQSPSNAHYGSACGDALAPIFTHAHRKLIE